MKYLKGSAYYLEDCLGLDLNQRANQGKLTFLLLNQPPVCNYNCRRCFMPTDRRAKKYSNSLSIGEYKRILEQAHKEGFLCLEISGEGEPLLSKQLSDIIKTANDNCIITTLITNGFNLTPDFIQLCKDNNVTLVISLFALNSSLYELDNNCEGSFDKILKNIELVAAIYSDTMGIVNNSEVYRVAIHTTVQTDNYDEIDKIKSFCHKNKIFFSIAPLAPVGGGEKMRDKIVQLENKKDLGDNSIILSRSSINKLGREVCGSCYYGLNIGYDGNLLFDAHAGYEVGDMLGNAKINDLSELIIRQRKIANKLYDNIDGFCPIRDNKWPNFINKFIRVNQLTKDFNSINWDL